ncbi:MAG: Calx-beta domain-containing protein, partial [Rubripirellula sp.]
GDVLVAGALTNRSTGAIRVVGTSLFNGIAVSSNLAFADGSLVNNEGRIELTNDGSNSNAATTLSVTSGSLINGPQGVIEILEGSGVGSRTIVGDLDNQGTLRVDRSGSVLGELTNSGTVELETPNTSLAVGSSFTQSSGGTVSMAVAGSNGSNSAQLDITGLASLDGTLELIIDPSASFTIDGSFIPINYGSFSSEFPTILGTDLGGGLLLVPGYGAAALSLAVMAATPRFIVDDVTVNETDGTASVVVTLVSDAGGPITVDVSTANGSALSPDDYTATTSTLSFAGTAGEQQTVTIPTVDDSVVESMESFTVMLSAPSNLSADVSDTAVVSITDNDTAILSITDVTVDEGDVATVTVTLDRNVQDGLIVDFATIDGTAFSGSDYTANSGTLTFTGTAGETQTINIPTVDDSLSGEPDIQFTVTLSTTTTAVDANDIGTITIQDNDVVVVPPPIASDVPLSTSEDTAITIDLSSFLSGGVTDSIVISMNGAQGNATIAGTLLTYLPDQDVFGSDVVTYVASNAGGSSSGTINISIASVNDPPSAVNDTVVSRDGNAILIAVVANDSAGPANEDQSLSIVSADATDGIAQIVGGEVLFTPNSGFSGNATINYTIQDSEGATAVAMIIVAVSAPGGIEGHVYCDLNGDELENAGEVSVGATVFLDTNRNGVQSPGELATQTDSGGNFLFDSVPDGAATVTLVIPNGCHAIPQKLATTSPALTLGKLVREIAVGDFDGDGDDDVYAISDMSGEINVLANNGESLALDGNIELGDRPQSIAVWHRSGLPDVAAVAAIGGRSTSASGEPSTGSVFLIENGVAQPIAMGDGPIDVAIDDFNDDGVPDLVSANYRSSDFQLMLSGSSGPTVLDTGNIPIGVATGDFDGDGLRDIVTADHGIKNPATGPSIPGSFRVHFGEDNGTFFADDKLDSFFELAAVGAANLDGIDRDELIVLGPQTLAVFQFDLSSGQMLQIAEVSLNERSRKFEVGDLNRDGLLDVVVTGFGSGTISFLLGDGTGNLTLSRETDNALSPADIGFGDFNGDQIDELIVAEVYQSSNGGLQGRGLSTTFSLSSSSRTIVPTVNVRQVVDFAPADALARLDVNRDNQITASDALRVINAINSLTTAEGESVSTVLNLATDVNADGQTSALDALQIINYLAQQQNASVLDQLESATDEDDKRKAADEVFANGLF